MEISGPAHNTQNTAERRLSNPLKLLQHKIYTRTKQKQRACGAIERFRMILSGGWWGGECAIFRTASENANARALAVCMYILLVLSQLKLIGIATNSIVCVCSLVLSVLVWIICAQIRALMPHMMAAHNTRVNGRGCAEWMNEYMELNCFLK